jgi:hypothetical protein
VSESDKHAEARQRTLALLRQALLIVDEELGDDLLGARLADCIDQLVTVDALARGMIPPGAEGERPRVEDDERT